MAGPEASKRDIIPTIDDYSFSIPVSPIYIIVVWTGTDD